MRRIRDLIPAATANLLRWRGQHQTAIGHPATWADYMADVERHNRECARFQRFRTDRTDPDRMTNSQRRAYREHVAHAIAARRLATLSEN